MTTAASHAHRARRQSKQAPSLCALQQPAHQRAHTPQRSAGAGCGARRPTAPAPCPPPQSAPRAACRGSAQTCLRRGKGWCMMCTFWQSMGWHCGLGQLSNVEEVETWAENASRQNHWPPSAINAAPQALLQPRWHPAARPIWQHIAAAAAHLSARAHAPAQPAQRAGRAGSAPPGRRRGTPGSTAWPPARHRRTPTLHRAGVVMPMESV